ncbi:hypothetical protein D0Z07_2623 [Hyphodiscus hymeniophilus]|uniref:NAD-dependent epimerase/dehydratase domain-containing protein n=1 Tax=Hyphodiscus hymeniophilus TaxID=353542 RepID=A0A9P7AZK6_9HELO|nr:hypothetical protein D0Z07_2623 [Hyphodiscus hymeniophilus]
MTSASLVGGTGLVGSYILSTLLNTPAISSVTAYSRRPIPAPEASPRLNPIIDSDSSAWATQISSLKIEEAPQIFFSALGTTKAKAGGLGNQRKIDFDLNLLLAKAAKDAGIKTYVLISGGLGGGGGTNSSNAFVRLKAELEVAVKELNFDHTVIIKPGLIVGDRGESRPIEAVFRGAAKLLGAISGGILKNAWAEDAEVIARAAVKAGLKASEARELEVKVWEVEQREILTLGQSEP